MVTVVKRPQGHKIIDQAVSAEISSYASDALVVFPNHALSNGDFIYLVSDIDEYNGFWEVTVVNANTFKISDYQGSFVQHYQDADVEYYQTSSHDWSSIFLPIVYKASNDRWPTNTVDVSRGINSAANDNGYTVLSLTGTVDVVSLDFIKVSGAMDDDLNNVWQVVEVTGSDITITLPYDAVNSFSGASVQKYYNNYQVKVKVYAGLNPAHPWAEHKPYELVGELSLTPDADNVVTFSIADYLRGKVNIRNNTTLFSLPLNLDAFTGFYISTAESYDESTLYAIATSESAFNIDTFQGYAIAGKLPFRNTYSGDYAEYILTTGSPAKWLTALSYPKMITERYFDISFIKNIAGAFQIIIDKYVQGYKTSVEVIDYEDNGIGVYRIPITADAQYDQFCVRAYTPGTADVPPITPPTLQDLVDWTNGPGVHPWSLGTNPTQSVNGSGGTSDYIVGTIPTIAGLTYNFYVAYFFSGGISIPITEVTIALLDGSYNELATVVFNYPSGGSKSEVFSLSPSSDGTYLGIKTKNNTPVDTKNHTIQIASFEGFNGGGGIPGVDAQNITEEICIDIVDICDIEHGVADENIRLLEDGDFRLLE